MKANKIIAYIVTILFFWVIYPYRFIVKMIFEIKKANAIKQADELCKQTNKQVYVVQYNKDFVVGLKREFRHKDLKIRKKIDGFLDWDYRNAIIYKTK